MLILISCCPRHVKTDDLQEMKKLVTEPDSSKKSSKVKKKLVGEYKATIQKLEKKLS